MHLYDMQKNVTYIVDSNKVQSEKICHISILYKYVMLLAKHILAHFEIFFVLAF